jgi:hypothetical protein
MPPPTIQTYRAYEARRYQIPLTMASEWPKIDQVSNFLYERARASHLAIYDEWQAPEQPSRRSMIFKSFVARDYQCKQTRLSIINALIQCNPKKKSKSKYEN